MRKRYLIAALLVAIISSISVPSTADAVEEFPCDLHNNYFYPWIFRCSPVGFKHENNKIFVPSNCNGVTNANGVPLVECVGPPRGYTCENTAGAKLQCEYYSEAQEEPSEPRTLAQQLAYIPLEPLPGLYNQTDSGLASLINSLFRILLVAGALFAVVTLVVGGVMYMVSDVVETKSTARKRIMAALSGLLILVFSWLILNTINPRLVTLGDTNIVSEQPTQTFNNSDGTTTASSTVDLSTQRYSATSESARLFMNSNLFKDAGFIGLKDADGVAVVSIAKDAADRAAVIQYLNHFLAQCFNAGGIFDVLDAENGTNFVYFCAETWLPPK